MKPSLNVLCMPHKVVKLPHRERFIAKRIFDGLTQVIALRVTEVCRIEGNNGEDPSPELRHLGGTRWHSGMALADTEFALARVPRVPRVPPRVHDRAMAPVLGACPAMGDEAELQLQPYKISATTLFWRHSFCCLCCSATPTNYPHDVFVHRP